MGNPSLTDDQVFLITFIFTVYFGPDMKKEPVISISERVYRQLPPYEYDELASSNIRITELERIFSYILRKADEVHQIKLFMLHSYLYGYFPEHLKQKYHCFSHFYLSDLHPYIHFNTVNIAFVHNPNIFHINKNVLERFRVLSRLQNLVLDRNSVLSYNFMDYDVPNPIPFQVAQPIEKSHQPPKPRCNNHGRQGRKPKNTYLVSNNNVLPATAQSPRVVSSGDNTSRAVVLALPCSNNPLLRRRRKFKKGKFVLPSSTYFPSGKKEIPTDNIISENKTGIEFTRNTATSGPAVPPGLIEGAKSEDPDSFCFSHPEFNYGRLEVQVQEDEQVLIRKCAGVSKQNRDFGPSSSS